MGVVLVVAGVSPRPPRIVHCRSARLRATPRVHRSNTVFDSLESAPEMPVQDPLMQLHRRPPAAPPDHQRSPQPQPQAQHRCPKEPDDVNAPGNSSRMDGTGA